MTHTPAPRTPVTAAVFSSPGVEQPTPPAAGAALPAPMTFSDVRATPDGRAGGHRPGHAG